MQTYKNPAWNAHSRIYLSFGFIFTSFSRLCTKKKKDPENLKILA
jgi:hypothetical protein